MYYRRGGAKFGACCNKLAANITQENLHAIALHDSLHYKGPAYCHILRSGTVYCIKRDILICGGECIGVNGLGFGVRMIINDRYYDIKWDCVLHLMMFNRYICDIKCEAQGHVRYLAWFM